MCGSQRSDTIVVLFGDRKVDGFWNFTHNPDRVKYERDGVDMVLAVPVGDGFIDYDAFCQPRCHAGVYESGKQIRRACTNGTRHTSKIRAMR